MGSRQAAEEDDEEEDAVVLEEVDVEAVVVAMSSVLSRRSPTWKRMQGSE